jgi:hypothetical protein
MTRPSSLPLQESQATGRQQDAVDGLGDRGFAWRAVAAQLAGVDRRVVLRGLVRQDVDEHLVLAGPAPVQRGFPGARPASHAVLHHPANPNTFPLLGAHVHGNLFFSACMMTFSLLGSALLITG